MIEAWLNLDEAHEPGNIGSALVSLTGAWDIKDFEVHKRMLTIVSADIIVNSAVLGPYLEWKRAVCRIPGFRETCKLIQMFLRVRSGDATLRSSVQVCRTASALKAMAGYVREITMRTMSDASKHPMITRMKAIVLQHEYDVIQYPRLVDGPLEPLEFSAATGYPVWDDDEGPHAQRNKANEQRK